VLVIVAARGSPFAPGQRLSSITREDVVDEDEFDADVEGEEELEVLLTLAIADEVDDTEELVAELI
jgi:hypothetical protein